uniref:Olfactomedin-like domain-containing protein n=1 Tax=Monopterus albus TaxID=43700 RepID=A0A3Q3JPC4_MONAL
SEGSVRNETGGGSGDRCTCEAFLPSSTFIIKDLVVVEQTVGEISHKLELEMGKVLCYILFHYIFPLESGLFFTTTKIIMLTVEIEQMEENPDDNNDADLEKIKVEIKLVEALIKELQLSINGSTTVFESLRMQITVMVETLNRLEKTYDKNMILATRREYIKVQLQLDECERRHQDLFNPNIGSCAHTGIIKVSKPTVSHLNAHLNTGYKFGGWGKDSKPVPDRESIYWYSGYTSTAGQVQETISSSETTLYYQINNPFGLAKLNFTTMKYESRVISKASSGFSYTNSPNQIFDFAADETGLWVTYATQESSGRMVIAKINEPSFGVEEEWQTSLYKPGVSNAFMVCGVLYAVETIDIQNEEIFYKYDTKTKQKSHISVLFERFQDTYSNLDYNPTDQKLYMYNDGYYVNYHLWFNHTEQEPVDKSLPPPAP